MLLTLDRLSLTDRYEQGIGALTCISCVEPWATSLVALSGTSRNTIG